jgi:hypothetical protein
VNWNLESNVASLLNFLLMEVLFPNFDFISTGKFYSPSVLRYYKRNYCINYAYIVYIFIVPLNSQFFFFFFFFF